AKGRAERTSQKAKPKRQKSKVKDEEKGEVKSEGHAAGQTQTRTAAPQEARGLGERLLEYGARIIKLVESLLNTLVGRRVADQLLRSGTSVGANYEEARAAESKDDFVHKLQIALKELRESNYCLRLLLKAGKVSAAR